MNEETNKQTNKQRDKTTTTKKKPEVSKSKDHTEIETCKHDQEYKEQMMKKKKNIFLLLNLNLLSF